VKSRAHEYGYSDVENAAIQLLELIDLKRKSQALQPSYN
jgi:hypothetical protein